MSRCVSVGARYVPPWISLSRVPFMAGTGRAICIFPSILIHFHFYLFLTVFRENGKVSILYSVSTFICFYSHHQSTFGDGGLLDKKLNVENDLSYVTVKADFFSSKICFPRLAVLFYCFSFCSYRQSATLNR